MFNVLCFKSDMLSYTDYIYNWAYMENCRFNMEHMEFPCN